MRRALWFLPALLLGLAVPAHSAPILVSAGDVVTFNFDFVAAGAIAAPPYEFTQFEPGVPFGSIEPGDFGLWTGYSELDGNGSVIFGPFSTNLLATLLPDTDGVFSMVLSMMTGSMTVNPVAYGYRDFALVTAAVTPSSAASVPEPATLTLMGLGGAAAAWGRRRSRAASDPRLLSVRLDTAKSNKTWEMAGRRSASAPASVCGET